MEIGTTMKINWKVRIISAVASGFVFTIILMMFNRFSDDALYTTNSLLLQGVFCGLFFGLGFPLLTEKFGKRFIKSSGSSIKPQLAESEEIEAAGPANLFRGIESVGGRLFLTNSKIIFKSHKGNIQRGQTDIPYTDVLTFVARQTGGIIDNGIRIKTKNGKEYDFVVNDRDQWMEQLQDRMYSYSQKS